MKFLRKLLIRWVNKKHRNLDPLIAEPGYKIFPRYEKCNRGIFNPLECIYFALLEVYENPSQLKIQGVRADYSSDPSKIIVHIHTSRPGLIIGFRGRDFDKLTSVLSRYFGKDTEIKLTEEKDLDQVFLSFF